MYGTRRYQVKGSRMAVKKDCEAGCGGEPRSVPVRGRILEAAFSAFTERGFAETSTLEIATRARASKRELYALFGSKQDMLVACISERAKRLTACRPICPSCATARRCARALTAVRRAAAARDQRSHRGRRVSPRDRGGGPRARGGAGAERDRHRGEPRARCARSCAARGRQGWSTGEPPRWPTSSSACSGAT